MRALALAFSAGMVATLNPCGFAMLPAYLSYFMGINQPGKTRRALMRSALGIGTVVSLGFFAVFGVAGIVITSVSRSLATEWVPRLALAVGAGLVVLGIALLFGYELSVGLPKANRGTRGTGYGNVLGFGMSYAVASLSCTLPVFLTVVATQITQRSLLGGVVVFLAYAAGMATVLLAITVVLALGKQSLVGKLRASARYINRISGAILVIAGAWIVWFWATALVSGAGALGSRSSFRFVEDISQRALNFIADYTLAVALVSIGVIAAAGLYVMRTRVPDNEKSHEDEKVDATGGPDPTG